MATMTLIGIYNVKPNLFEYLDLPDGIDKETVRDNILLKSANFEVLYSNPEFIHDAIKVWSAKWYRTFDRWQKALAIDYDPLENYDRREEWTDTGNGKSTVKGTTEDSANVTTEQRVSENVTTEQKVSAYNSDTMRDNVETTTGSSSESSIDNTNTSESSIDNTNTSETKNVRTGRAHGNIGVTTSQQMLEAELSVARWNLYDHIADLFLSEFVIPVY